MSEPRRQSEHINHIGQVKRETMGRRDCMRMEMVIDKKDSVKMEMVMDRRERMKELQLGVTHRRHKDHEQCYMEASFRVQ
jgi:hypothetical protein